MLVRGTFCECFIRMNRIPTAFPSWFCNKIAFLPPLAGEKRVLSRKLKWNCCSFDVLSKFMKLLIHKV